MQQSIVTTWTDKNPGKLADLHPIEIDYFKRRFVWSYQTGGFYIRTAYERVHDWPKWRPFRTRGQWQKLHSNLVDDLVEKHLDFDRFCRTPAEWLRPQQEETAFWFGMMAGDHTYNDCIDIDSHEIVGWIQVPTRWHPISMGPILDHNISWRAVPVIRPSLRFFQVAKVVYDYFPNRIWAFSSANLGLAVWKVHNMKQPSHVLHNRCTKLFGRVGLPAKLEHYPCPPKSGNSFGKCHRRPCGMDSGIITKHGVIIDSVKQIQHFMRPSEVPSFDQIVRACLTQMSRSYWEFIQSGESTQHKRLRKEDRKKIVAKCLDEIKRIKDWHRNGCFIDHELIAQGTEQLATDVDVEPIVEVHSVPEAIVNQHDSTYPACFWNVDLAEISRSGQWIPFVKFLVENGFPCDDSFLEVVSTLAKWFVFVELHSEDISRVKHVLCQFVDKKNNGNVTRLSNGQKRDVVQQIDRIVNHVVENESDDGRLLFAQIRQKRENDQYTQQYNFESQIIEGTSSFSDSPLPSHLLRRGIREGDSQQGDWKYNPDNNALPEQLQTRILNAFKDAGRPLRKRNGQYPTLAAITRFINFLISGRKSGQRRVSKKLLHEMGLPGKTKELNSVIRVLLAARLLHKGDYRSRSKSRLWILDASVLETMKQQNETIILGRME